ncbi:MAG: hypothetical protein DPW14_08195, partial [Planctomycetes bacterium]|nr:hypothetical protein [Planctomycetota bacterium]
ISWTVHPDPAVRAFSGTARYRTKFTLPPGWCAPGCNARLDLGRLWTIASATLNGQPLGISWTAPFTIDASTALRDGENELIVEVTNTWHNRLVGDDRSVVHDAPGTTRDAVDTVVDTPDGPLRFVDTAGMRRKSRIDEPTEYYSLVRALQAVDRADAALAGFAQGTRHGNRHGLKLVPGQACLGGAARQCQGRNAGDQ